MKRIDALRKTAKYLVAGASSIVLFATAFSTPALAAAKDDLDAFVTNSLSELSQATVNGTAPKSITNDEPIVIQGDTVIIQGDTTATAIRTAMQSADPDVATTVLFKNQIVITTDQGMDGPFDSFSWLKYVKADEGAKVSFAAATGANNPTLKYFFYRCSNLESIDGLSAWDVSNVTGDECMWNMFCGCSQLTSLEGLSTWDVSKVSGTRCMCKMFKGCSELSSLDGLATWNLSSMGGESCMNEMFNHCLGITSLEGLSAWDVSNVAGYSCMEQMFNDCPKLASIAGLQNWNIAGASSSQSGVDAMFGNFELSDYRILSSLQVNPPNGFQINTDMQLPSDFPEGGGNFWWPEKGATKGISLAEMITKSADTATYGNRWVRSEENINPYIMDAEPTITWTTTTKSYTGLNQTIGPDKVEVNGVELTPGVDYAVYYTKAASGAGEETTYPIVRDEGVYTAKLYLQGKYVGKDNPSYTQTVYVTSPGTVSLSFNAGEGTFASTGTNVLSVINLVSGQTLDGVEEPTLNGYTFAGWEDEAGNPVSFPLTIPDANATYTATWSSEPGPGPTPGPEPTPTPEPTPASDGTLIPSTADTTSMASAVLTLTAAALFGMAALGLALSMRTIKQR